MVTSQPSRSDHTEALHTLPNAVQSATDSTTQGNNSSVIRTSTQFCSVLCTEVYFNLTITKTSLVKE